MRITQFTHYDLDGVISFIVLNQVMKRIDVYSTGYKKLIQVSEKLMINKNSEDLYITDLSLGKELIERFKKRFERVHLFDHHPDSILLKDLVDDFNFTTEMCGANIVFEKFKNEIPKKNFSMIEKIVNLANDYDLFRLEIKGSYALNELFYFYGWNKFVKRFDNGFDKFTEDEKQMVMHQIRLKQNEINNMHKSIFPEHKKNAFFGTITPDMKFQFLINDITTLFKLPIDYYFVLNENEGIVSIRSKPGTDLAVACKKAFDGIDDAPEFGGHPNAGGLKLTRSNINRLSDFILRIYEQLELQ